MLLSFLRLGCVSFGGPIAHLGYFHTELVERQKWCDEESFAEIVALAQSMPGPASSQVGFMLGLLRAGWKGGVAAWIGFTMPSALLMVAFGLGHTLLTGKFGLGVVHGLQLVAVAVVAQAILSMRKSLAPDVPRMGLALFAAAIAFVAPPEVSTVLAIGVGAVGGLLQGKSMPENAIRGLDFGVTKSAGSVATVVFGLLLVLSVALGVGADRAVPKGLAVFGAFYRTGALVFGGGHVVLPLLENAVVARGWVDQPSFLAGYGAAQALPGPLFTFAAYLGAVMQPASHPVWLSALALIAIFLPGLLVVIAVLPYWSSLRERSEIRSVLKGVNAAVVGVLVAAFVRPVWTSAIHRPLDLAISVAALAFLVRGKIAPWVIVIAVMLVSAVASALS